MMLVQVDAADAQALEALFAFVPDALAAGVSPDGDRSAFGVLRVKPLAPFVDVPPAPPLKKWKIPGAPCKAERVYMKCFF